MRPPTVTLELQYRGAPARARLRARKERTVMKITTDEFDPKTGTREDGAPVDYARYRAEDRDRLAATDIMLALVLDKDDEQKGPQRGFDPYNSAGT